MMKIDKNGVLVKATGQEMVEDVLTAVEVLYKTMRASGITKEEFVDFFFEMVDEAMETIDKKIDSNDTLERFLEFLKKEIEENE